MSDSDVTRAHYPALLDGQFRLLARRRADVAALSKPGVERDEAAIDRIANDLVGARLVIRAALSAPSADSVPGATRDEPERRERDKPSHEVRDA